MVKPIYYFWLVFSVVIFCFSIPYTYAGYPGECTAIKQNGTWVSHSAYQNETFYDVACNGTGGLPSNDTWQVAQTGRTLWSLGTGSQYFQLYYWENDQWNYQTQTSLNYAYSGSPDGACGAVMELDECGCSCPVGTSREVGGCECIPDCEEGFERVNGIGECVPECDTANGYSRNNLGECVYCPSGYFTLGNSCLPYCPHGTDSYAPGEIYNDYVKGTCVGPECGPDEILINNKCTSQCTAEFPIDTNTGACKSNTPYDPTLPPGDEAPQVPDPLPPVPDVPVDPAKTPDENNTEQLKAIKDVADQQLTALEGANKYLENLDRNTAKTVNNLDAINTNMQTSTGILSGKLDGIKTAIEESGGGGVTDDQIKDIGDEFGNELAGLATGQSMPDQPTFATDLPTDNDYTEYDNIDERTTAMANADYAATTTQLNDGQTPFDGEITASATDACVSGVVHGTAFNACFDKPWMIQGYAIMKVIFIGLGYLQTAILLNKAIVA